MRAGGDPRHGNRCGSDLVRHVLADEDHFDRRGGTRPLAAEARDADEEVQATHLGGRGIVDRRETTAAESGEDRLRRTADEHHRHRGIDCAAAAGKYVSPACAVDGCPAATPARVFIAARFSPLGA